MKKNIEVIPSPALYPYYDTANTIVVMVDAIRASATIATAFHYGINHIVPLDDIELTRTYREKGYLISAERNADKVEGFDKGNSPFEFMDEDINNQYLAMTTTNGTKAIRAANGFNSLVVGGFVNFNAVYNYLLQSGQHITVLCSGWKLRVNVEDQLFAGKLAEALFNTGEFQPASDASTMAQSLYKQSSHDLYTSIMQYSPRLAGKEDYLGRDIDYCLKEQNISTVPLYRDGKITAL